MRIALVLLVVVLIWLVILALVASAIWKLAAPAILVAVAIRLLYGAGAARRGGR